MFLRYALAAVLAGACVGSVPAAPVPPIASTSPQDPTGGAKLGVELGDSHELIDGLWTLIGQRVNSVFPRGAAAGTGIKAGDIIVGVGSGEVKTIGDLRGTLGMYRPGATVPVTVLRRDADNVNRTHVVRVRLYDVIGDGSDAAIGVAWPPAARVIVAP